MVREWVDWMAGIVGLAVRWLAFMLIIIFMRNRQPENG